VPFNGIQLVSLTGVLEPEALCAGELRFRVESAVVRISSAGLAAAVPREVPVRMERIARGVLSGHLQMGNRRVPLSVRPRLTANGRLGLAPAGFLGLLAGPVRGFIQGRLPNKPGLHRGTGDDLVEIDPAQIVREAGIELPPLSGLRVDEGLLELRFGKAGSGT
jgi:hypothetical protein